MTVEMEINDITREFAELILEELKDGDKYEILVEHNNHELEFIDVCFEFKEKIFASKTERIFRMNVRLESRKIYSRSLETYKVYPRSPSVWKYDTDIKTAVDIVTAIKTASDNIEHLFYDNEIDMFINRQDPKEMRKYRLRKLRQQVFKHSHALTNKICCVCHEYTLNTTPCNHILCGRCWESLSIERLTCPYCREDIRYCDGDDQ